MAYGTLAADQISTSVTGSSIGPGNATRFKNRIINGDIRIDQRNAGVSVTPTADQTYTVDRWEVLISQASKISVQQQTSVVPTGFTNAVKITSLAATSLGAGDYFCFAQHIEGFNIADLGWGTVNAKTVTLSFQVYSSLTGTFGGNISNGSQNRAYPFTYSISSANTWTSVSVTIPGDTTGTWNTTNGRGIWLQLGLGVGTTYSGTAGSWKASALLGATGATSVVGTSGATFYITGVQLEVGSSATGFEYVDYTMQLAMCQRYYENSWYPVASSAGLNYVTTCIVFNTNYATGLKFMVTKRTSPTVTLFSRNGTSGQVSTTASGADATAAAANNIGPNGCWGMTLTTGQTAYGAAMEAAYSASAEL